MPLFRTSSLLLLCCAWFAAARLFAAAPDSPFIVDSWTAENGLPDNEGVSLLQSRSGYLWIGTLHGLVRFDGNKFTLFDEMNTPGLKSDRIVFLYEDQQTNLWIGTQSDGLAVIQNGKITSFEKETAGAGKVTAASESGNDISFYAEFGFAQYHDGRMTYYPGVRSLQLYFREQHLTLPVRDGGEWQLFRGRVQKVAGNRLEKDFGPWPWGNAFINAGCEDENGNLIVGTLGEGIFWFDADGHYRRITTADGLSSDSILSLCLDSEGGLWAGTDSGGIDRIKRKIFNNIPGLHPRNVRSIAQDAAGGLWTAYNAAGVSYWNSNGIHDFRLGHISSASAVLVDARQNVWAGTSTEGLFLFQSREFVHAPGADILGANILALFESRDGTLWAGSQNGLGRRDGQNWKLFTTADGLSGNAVSAITEDSAGNLWIGTQDSGLNSFDGKKFTFYGITNGLPGDDISCLYVDREGTLWVGTSAHGLARLENGKWKCFSMGDGLASNSIGYIIGDDDGYLWIGSNRGLMRIALKSFDEPGPLFCHVYGRADGLPTRECSSGSQPCAMRSSDGKLWFPTIDGLVWTDPANIKPDLRPPQVLIEFAQVDGQEQNTNPLNSAWSSSVTIPPGNEQLDIDYTALNFSDPQAVRFRYRLEGHETEWTEAGDLRVAHYPALPPGHYKFNVVACNEDGNWNGTGAFLDVTVLPQFWQTDTFRVTTILIVLGAIVGVVRYLSTQKLHRQVQLMKQREALEHERARIARDLHDQLGANLTQVALLGEMAEADKHLPDEVEAHTRQISQTARETTRSLDEIVWAVNPSNDTLEGLANYVCKYAQEYLALANLPCRVDVPAQLPSAAIPPEVRHNVFLAFKEAVHNVVKHAHAHEVWVRLALRPKQFLLQVEDNGRGLSTQAVTNRNGLRNMKKRMEDIGGDFSVSAGAHGGTLVQLTVPLMGVETLKG
ncbi:MAG TPA: two-component regulator propeller domain-containing protein [Candidatus Sulfotelmatobacter sp.]|nr:two-component regulator propeller domain-containing protein [Candidatus Sulfotelmatobacter sp.]